MAIGPIQYLPQQDPFSGLGELVQAGQMIQQQRLKQQQQEAAQQRMQQYQTDVEEYFKSPTAQGAARLSAKYPEQSKAFEEGWKTLNAQQQQSELKDTQSVIAALSQGRADIAQSLISKRAEALRAAGQDAGELDSMLELVKTNPDQAKGYMMFTLAALPGGKDAVEALGKIGVEKRAQELQPSALGKAEAEAQKAGVEAKFAERDILSKLEERGWNVKNIQSQIEDRKADQRIKAMQVSLAKEDNALKRQQLQLQIDEAQSKKADKLREKVATVESGAQNIDNMLNTVDRILQNKSLNDVLGTIEGRLPAFVSDEASDAIALIDTLGSQAFLSQIPTIKGTGALSNAEGEKLQSALQNLSRSQSESQFKTNLKEAQRLLLKSRSSLEKQYGVKAGPPDTPAVKPSGSEIDALIQKYGG